MIWIESGDLLARGQQELLARGQNPQEGGGHHITGASLNEDLQQEQHLIPVPRCSAWHTAVGNAADGQGIQQGGSNLPA